MKLISILSLLGEKQSGGLCSDHTSGGKGARTLIKSPKLAGLLPTLHMLIIHITYGRK